MEKASAPKQTFLSAALADLRHRPQGNVPCLDILRSAAILLVFSAHAGGSFSTLPITKLPFIYWGWTGVDLFFILSGYLIGGQLWKELKRTGNIQVGRFILRRGFRIWPLYFSFLLCTFVLYVISSHPLNGFGTDLLFLSNYADHTNVAGSWSLSTEEQFYIAFPLVLWLGSRFIPVKSLIVVPAAWLIALPLLRALTLQVWASADESALYFPFHTHSDGLAVGLLIAWVAAFYPERMKTAWVKNTIVFVALIALAVLLRNGVSRPIFAFSALALIYGACSLFLLRLPNPPGWFGWSGFYVISRLSYGIYLNHFWVLDYLPPAIKPYIGTGTVGFLLCWCIAWFVASAIAFMTFAAVELPFLRMRETFLSHRTAPLKRV